MKKESLQPHWVIDQVVADLGEAASSVSDCYGFYGSTKQYS